MKFNLDKRRIGVDVDDTQVDFVGTYILYHNQAYGTNLKKENFRNYSFNKTIGGTMEDSIKMMNKFYESHFFKEITPLPDSAKIIKLLKQKGYELFSITSRPDFIRAETEDFINKFYPGCFSDLFFSYNYYTKRKNEGKTKAEICLDNKISILVDDSLDYCIQCKEKGINPFLFGDNPWNQDGKWSNSIRVKDWLEVGERLSK